MIRQTFSGKWMMAATLAVAGLTIPATAQTTGQNSRENQDQNQNSQWNQDQNSRQNQGESSRQNQPYQQQQWGQPGQAEGQNAPAFVYPRQRFTQQGQTEWQQNRGQNERRFNNRSYGQSYQPGEFQAYDHSNYGQEGNWNGNQQGQPGWSNESGFEQGRMNRQQNGFTRLNGQQNWQGQPGNWEGQQSNGRTIVLAVGRIVGTRRFRLEGENASHEFAILQTRSGRDVIADLGPRSELQNVSLTEGTKLACVGRVERVDGQPVLEAGIVSDITEIHQNRQAQQAGMRLQANRPSQFQNWVNQQEQQGQQSSFANQGQNEQNGSRNENQNESGGSYGSYGGQDVH